MSASVADIFEEYVESKVISKMAAFLFFSYMSFLLLSLVCIGLQNLPSEIDQNMHELRSMDEEFQRMSIQKHSKD